MILYVNGDSHSHGMSIKPKETFAYLVAEKFKYQVENRAQIGSSNQSIIRTTLQDLEKTTPDFVLIGWTTWEREEWLHQGNYYNVNSSGHDSLPEDLQERYKHWVLEQSPDQLKSKSQQWHEKIYEFHKTLTTKKIKHLFFNCMYNFFGIDQTHQQDWNNSYLDPYDNDSSYYWYLNKQGYKSDPWFHYGADAHWAWAQRLIEHMEKYA